jgi:hypothetical protein
LTSSVAIIDPRPRVLKSPIAPKLDDCKAC